MAEPPPPPFVEYSTKRTQIIFETVPNLSCYILSNICNRVTFYMPNGLKEFITELKCQFNFLHYPTRGVRCNTGGGGRGEAAARSE